MAKSYAKAPAMVIDRQKAYQAVLRTEKGDIRVDLFADRAPVTVNNFVFLAREGFYDRTTFHRVINNFMAQGGDPDGTGRGGPGYKWPDEASALDLPHDSAGILSMANSGPDSNGSQFFITHRATPHLDGRHAVFGRVADQESLKVLMSLKTRDPSNAAGPGDRILGVDILET
jgi:peptidyl-prolyl cis-trans isomerase B (cyclophilin B)